MPSWPSQCNRKCNRISSVQLFSRPRALCHRQAVAAVNRLACQQPKGTAKKQTKVFVCCQAAKARADHREQGSVIVSETRLFRNAGRGRRAGARDFGI